MTFTKFKEILEDAFGKDGAWATQSLLMALDQAEEESITGKYSVTKRSKDQESVESQLVNASLILIAAYCCYKNIDKGIDNTLYTDDKGIVVDYYGNRNKTYSEGVKGWDKVFTALLNHPYKQDLNTLNNGFAPIHYLAMAGSGKLIKALLKAGGNVNLQDINGMTALDFAIEKEYEAMIAMLRANGAKTKAEIAKDPQSTNTAAASSATQSTDKTSAINFLLQNVDKLLITSLNLAALYAKKANINRSTFWEIAYQCDPSNNNHEKIAQLFVKVLNIFKDNFGPDSLTLIFNQQGISQDGKISCAVIHLIAKSGKVALMEALLAAGANIELKDAVGKTALMYATEFNRQEMKDLLIKHEQKTTASQSTKATVPAASSTTQEAKPSFEEKLKKAIASQDPALIASLLDGVDNESLSKEYTIHSETQSFDNASLISIVAFYCCVSQRSFDRLTKWGSNTNNWDKVFLQLLEKKIISPNSLSRTDKFGYAPIHYVVQMMRTNGVDEDNKDIRTPLFNALIKAGAGVNVKTADGQKTIDIAKRYHDTQDPEFIETLEKISKEENAKKTRRNNSSSISGFVQSANASRLFQLINNDAFAESLNSTHSINKFGFGIEGASLLWIAAYYCAEKGADPLWEKIFSDLLKKNNIFPMDAPDFLNKENGSDKSAIIHLLAKSGNVELMEKWLAKKPNINLQNNEGLTALRIALQTNNKALVELLIANGARVDVKDQSGNTQAQYAYQERPHLVPALGQNNEPTKSVQNALQQTDGSILLPFISSASSALLSERYAIPRSPIEGVSLAWIAAYHCLSLDNENLKSWDKVFLSLLGRKDIFTPEMLNEKGGPDGRAAIHFIAQAGNLELLKALLKAGADINLQDKDGATVMHLLAKEKNVTVIEFLLTVKPEPNLNLTDSEGNTAIHLVANQPVAHKGSVDMMKALLKAKPDLNLQDGSGKNALHIVASHGNVEMLNVLLAAGADIKSRDKDGFTAIHLAAKNGNPEMMKGLLAAGADITLQDAAGKTALKYVMEEGAKLVVGNYYPPRYKEVFDLLNKKEKENTILEVIRTGEGSDKSAVIHVAAQIGNVGLMKKLLDAGANVDSRDEKGKTALEYAIDCEDIPMQDVLIKHIQERGVKEALAKEQFYVNVGKGAPPAKEPDSTTKGSQALITWLSDADAKKRDAKSDKQATFFAQYIKNKHL